MLTLTITGTITITTTTTTAMWLIIIVTIITVTIIIIIIIIIIVVVIIITRITMAQFYFLRMHITVKTDNSTLFYHVVTYTTSCIHTTGFHRYFVYYCSCCPGCHTACVDCSLGSGFVVRSLPGARDLSMAASCTGDSNRRCDMSLECHIMKCDKIAISK